MTEKGEKPYRGLMYGALDENGERVGNPIKSSRLCEEARIEHIEKKIEENHEHLKDLPRRKRLAGRIRGVLRECVGSGNVSRSDIERHLAEKDITVVFRVNEDGRLTGATFVDHREKIVYNGSSLGKDLSANEWHKLFTESATEAPEREEREQSSVEVPIEESREITTSLEPESQPISDDVSTVETEEVEYEYVDHPEHGGHVGLGLLDDLIKGNRGHEHIDKEFRALYKRKKVKRIKR